MLFSFLSSSVQIYLHSEVETCIVMCTIHTDFEWNFATIQYDLKYFTKKLILGIDKCLKSSLYALFLIYISHLYIVRISRVTCAGEGPDESQRKDQLHHDQQVVFCRLVVLEGDVTPYWRRCSEYTVQVFYKYMTHAYGSILGIGCEHIFTTFCLSISFFFLRNSNTPTHLRTPFWTNNKKKICLMQKTTMMAL